MSRFNTGNPLDSNDPRDLDDNAKNLDQAVNAEQDTFQDRLGKSRLTWAGIEKAGTGNPAIAVDAASRAVAASNAAFINADVYPDVAAGLAAVAVGEQFQVLSADGLEYRRYRKDSETEASEVGSGYPTAAAVARVSELTTFYGPDKFTREGFYGPSGGWVASEFYFSTLQLPVYPDRSYALVAETPGNSYCIWYDEFGAFISSFKAAAVVTSPANAGYVALSTLTITPSTGIRARDVELSLDAFSLALDRLSLDVSPLLRQEYGPEHFTESGYINSNGTIVGSGSGYTATDFLPVLPETGYAVTVRAVNNAHCAWYDQDRGLISTFQSSAAVPVQHESPASAAYIRLSTTEATVGEAGMISTAQQFNTSELLKALQGADLGLSSDQIDYNGAPLSEVIEDLSTAGQNIRVVKTLEELHNVTPYGVDNRAYPAGLTVYDEGLRSSVTADGIWWRLPDGTPADVAERTYVYPGFDDVRKRLPEYATAYSKLAETDSLAGWSVTGGEMRLRHVDGKSVIEVEGEMAATQTLVYMSATPLPLHKYAIFDLFYYERPVGAMRVHLYSSTGTILFRKPIQRWTVLGANPRQFMDRNDLLKCELDLTDMDTVVEGASLSDVYGIGFSFVGVPTQAHRFWVGEIESASFRPCLTLRFDDARASIYPNAFLKMQSLGFPGITAVHTDYVGNSGYLDESQLLEMKAAGWDLVSHGTHQPPNGVNALTYEELVPFFEDSKEALKTRFGSPLIARSCYIAPQNQHDPLPAKVSYKYYDCKVGLPGVLNRAMPRRPIGAYQSSGTWATLGSFTGDAKNANQLIAAAQEAIDRQGWQMVMLHDILDSGGSPSTVVFTHDFNEFMDWLDDHRGEIDVVSFSEMVKRMEGVS